MKNIRKYAFFFLVFFVLFGKISAQSLNLNNQFSGTRGPMVPSEYPPGYEPPEDSGTSSGDSGSGQSGESNGGDDSGGGNSGNDEGENGSGGEDSGDNGNNGNSSGSSGSSDGSSSSSGNSEPSAPQKTEPYDGATEDLGSYTAQESELSEGCDSIATGEQTGAAAQAAEGAASLREQYLQTESNNEEVITENKTEVAEEAAEEKSETSGDPVKISKGTYELFETDLVIGATKQFEIKRRYESDQKITGSFGYGWVTNLDERIIAGTNPSNLPEIISTQVYMVLLDSLRRNLEMSIIQSYKVSSILSASDELDARIAKCEKLLLNAENLEDDLRVFISRSIS